MKITVGQGIDTLEVLVSGPQDSSLLAVAHARGGQLVSDHRVKIDSGVPTRVGEGGPVAQLDFFDSRDELRAWHKRGGARLTKASGCVSG
jgi:hypothetical protein